MRDGPVMNQSCSPEDPFRIRAAQIDLNRQKESMDFIRGFIDFIKENGYNSLVFYIAWRVRIRSHPWPSAEEAYDSDEIGRIVDYALTSGIKIIPATNVTYVTSLLKYGEAEKYRTISWRLPQAEKSPRSGIRS